MTATDPAHGPFERLDLRKRWAELRPESLIMAARRLSPHYGFSSKVMKNDRARYPELFPRPIPILGAERNKRLAIYSGAEMDHWAAHGRDIDEAEGSYGKLRAHTLATAETVAVVQLAKAATFILPEEPEDVAVRRVRGWRENRDMNDFPGHLHVDADYTLAAMVYSLRELLDWASNYLGYRVGPNDHEISAMYSARRDTLIPSDGGPAQAAAS